MATAFEKLHPDIQHALWEMNWRELRPLQSDAINAWFEGSADLLLMAHTAAGKTEAAFLPILSAIASDHGAGSFRVLYIGPLKALINDQFRRLDQLCARAEIPVHRWHGDVDAGRKRKAAQSPSGVLLITPESLEAMLMLRGREIPRLFARLEAIVVDELHSFLDGERGRQLSSLLNRLESAKGGARPRRVGLSATIGGTDAALGWLQAGASKPAMLIEGEPSSQARLLVKAFVTAEPAKDHGEDEEPEVEHPGLLGIAEHLHANFRGKTNLVFCNAKNQIEELADLLQKIAMRKNVPLEFQVHHGSLSREIRMDVEKALQSGKPCTALCSSTLELGIDVGHCDAVGQVSPPHSVSSLRQRLGRSGRRDGSVPTMWLYLPMKEPRRNAPVSDRLYFPLLRAVAEIELMLEKWVEPPFENPFDLSTLTQQVLSIIRQSGGMTAADLHRMVIRAPVFNQVSPALFADLLRDLAAVDLIEQTTGGDLILGLEGEHLTANYEFYAAFETQEEWDVTWKQRTIGSLAPAPGYQPGSCMLLAGKRWMIRDLDQKRKVILVEPAAKKLPLIFPGWSGHVHRRIRQKMIEVLSGNTLPGYLDASAQERLQHARAFAKDTGIANWAWVRDGLQMLLVNGGGSRENQLLATYLTLNGIAARAWPAHSFELGLVLDSECSPADVNKQLRSFAATPPDLVSMCESKFKNEVPPVGKHAHFLGRTLRAKCFSAANFDLHGALTILSDQSRDS